VADRGLCSYAHVALLVQAGVHAVRRVGARQIVDVTPGRPFVRPSVRRTSAELYRQRWQVRNLTGAPQDHDADGCAARSNGTRHAEGTDRLCHRLQPGPYGHVLIGQTPTPRRGADQLSGCAAMARRPEHRHAVRGLDREPRPPASGGAARQEATAQELPVDDQTSARTASAVGTARAQGLTSCHSAKSHYLAPFHK
jgi:hypothetical protein